MNSNSIDWLKNAFGHVDKITKKAIMSIPKGIMDEVEQTLNDCPEYETIKHVIYCVSHEIELRKCATCGKTLTYSKAFVFHCEYCSYSCIDNHRRADRVKEAMQKKYGVDNISQLDAIKEKKRQTSLSHYGTENVFQSEEVKNRQKHTCIERYGVENVFQNDEVKKKSKETNNKRYGTDYACQNDEVKKRIVATNIARYGVKSPLQNEAIKEKINSTCIERFGTDNIFKSKSFIRRNLDRTYEELKERFRGIVIPMFSKEEYTGHYHDEVYRWKCVKCGEEFEQKIYNTNHLHKIAEAVPRCMKCYPFVSGFSREEKEVLDFVKSIYSGEVIENDRSIITPYELDIYIPEKHVAIEFDGIYWHSDANEIGADYHSMKTRMCGEKSIRLIHVFENEWSLKQEIVKDRLRSILGVGQERIFARNCTVSKIGSMVANDFLEANHLQGGDNSSIRYGLFYNDELVAVMTFGKPRFSRGYDFELIRFATKIGCHIVGGASKLLNHFRSSHSGSIVSYADRRYSDGHLYEKLGFSLVGVSKPNYVWMKKGEMLTRYQCQKHRLSSVLGDDFDESESESQNMARNGWNRIYDCGNLVYKLDAR